jgi:hypothetical protein
VGYAQNAAEVFAPAIGTWKHPQNRSQNADEFGHRAGQLVYETGFAAIAGGFGAYSAKGVNVERFASLLSGGKNSAVLAFETADTLPVIKNKNLEDFFAKKKYAVSEVPPTTEITGQVFLPHTTDSYSAKEGDIRIAHREWGNGFKAYLEVKTAKAQWVLVDFFDNKMADLFYSKDEKTLIQKSDQLIQWLQTYKGKVLEVGHSEKLNCALYKTREEDSPNAEHLKKVASQVGAEQLPRHVEFSGDCFFGIHPPRAQVEDGSVWFKRFEGAKGKSLVGDWQPHVAICGQWIECKIDPSALQGDLLHFKSLPDSKGSRDFLSDAMKRGKFSFERLVRDTDPNAPLRYLLLKH